MAAPTRKVLAGSIHRIREFELEKVCLAEEFDILQIVGEGWFGKILLVEHKGTDTEMVLKALPKPYVCLRDFYREFHYGLHLGAHKNIITTYDVAFETAGFYVFSQEYAPLGDLTSNVSDTGIGELHTKRVAKQLGAALDHVHARDLVHRDVKLDNILVFKSDFSRIKLCDFGETRKSQTEIRRRNEWLPYSPPEILHTVVEDTYKAVTSHDVWQFGIVIFVCLTGCLPWQKAALDDPRYVRYLNWYNTSNPLRKQPKLFKLVSSRAQKMFKRFLEPRPDKRPPGLGDLHKYIEDRWMAKGINEKNGTAGTEVDELCPSMYSFHSDIDEKNKLLHVLLQHGIETTVDRVAKKARIKDWIQNSVIAEEDENETDDSYGNSRYQSDEESNDRRETLHPIEKNHLRWSSLRYTDEKHINPRTGEVLDKGKPINSNSMTTVSYDMQNIQPITTVDALVKHNTAKDESPSHGSIKDSAYGSLDLKPSLPKNVSNNQNSGSAPIQEHKPPIKSDLKRPSPKNVSNNKKVSSTSIQEQKPPMKQPQYPSQQLQQHLQRQNINLNMNTSQYKNFLIANSNPNLRNGNISSTKSSPSSSTEIRNSQSILQKSSASTSSSTLARSAPQTLNPVQGRLVTNTIRAESLKSFVPMKDSPYDTSNNNLSKANESNEIVEDSTNVVQGQMRINPYGTAPTNNIKSRVLNPQIVNLNKGMNGQQSSSKENVLVDADTQESLIKIRQMLLENKTGLPE